MKTAAICVVFLTLSLAGCGVVSRGVPELTRTDALTILRFSGHTDVNLVAIVQGVGHMGLGAFSSPTAAIIIASAKQNGRNVGVELPLFYDQNIGWFYFEKKDESIRLWTKTGYREESAAPRQ